MRLRGLYLAAGFVVGLLAADSPAGERGSATESRSGPSTRPTPVLVELYTSEGCSSCPPADALLSELAEPGAVEGVEVIPLAFHVDYWNRLGWKDPFSSAKYSERQRRVVRDIELGTVYTPLMVVDGRHGFVGSRRAEARRRIVDARGEPRWAISLVARLRSEREIEVELGIGERDGPSGSPRLYLALTEDRLETEVPRGENAGRTLQHDGVVRVLIDEGRLEKSELESKRTVRIALRPEWNRGRLAVVAWLQDVETQRILGARRVSVPERS